MSGFPGLSPSPDGRIVVRFHFILSFLERHQGGPPSPLPLPTAQEVTSYALMLGLVASSLCVFVHIESTFYYLSFPCRIPKSKNEIPFPSGGREVSSGGSALPQINSGFVPNLPLTHPL